MNVPSRFTLAGKEWTIEEDDRLDDDDELGNCHGYRCRVTYSTTPCDAQLRDTILHECFHAIAYENGLSAELKDSEVSVNEEMIIRRMSSSTLAFLRGNPVLVKFLLAR